MEPHAPLIGSTALSQSNMFIISSLSPFCGVAGFLLRMVPTAGDSGTVVMTSDVATDMGSRGHVYRQRIQIKPQLTISLPELRKYGQIMGNDTVWSINRRVLLLDYCWDLLGRGSTCPTKPPGASFLGTFL